MTAKNNGIPGLNLNDVDYGTKAAKAFWEKHEGLLVQCRNLVDNYAQENNGDALLLLDACFLALAQSVRSHLSQRGVFVQKLPPTLGELLSQRMPQ